MTSGKINIKRPEESGVLIAGIDETGTIVSVFDKAVNIRISDRRLVSIVRHASAMTPMGIHCPALLDHKEARLWIGRTVLFKAGILTTDNWRMDTNGSNPFEGLPRIENQLVINGSKINLFDEILHMAGRKEGLLGVGRPGISGNVFLMRGREIVEKMMRAGRAHLSSSLVEFTGLGPGYTPSGDDLICGFLMGEFLARRQKRMFTDAALFAQGPMFDQKDKALLMRAAEGTNDAGRTLIWMALRGRFPKFLCRAVEALNTSESAKDMLAMVTKAARYGHASGTDTLTGLLLYFKTYLGQPSESTTGKMSRSMCTLNRSLNLG